MGSFAVVAALAVVNGAPGLAGTNEAPPTLVRTWGEFGTGLPNLPQYLPSLDGVAVAADGSVYATDGAERIEKVTRQGAMVTEWGGEGTGDGLFTDALGIAVGPGGDVYVGDHTATPATDRVQRFSADGAFEAALTVGEVADVTVDGDGNVYVAGGADGSVKVFSPTGTPVAQWDLLATDAVATAIALDSSGAVYVTDQFNFRVEVYTSTGDYQRQFASRGFGDGQFGPGGGDLAIDGADRVYLADGEHARVLEFTSAGAYVGAWVVKRPAELVNHTYTGPVAIATGPDDHVWTAASYPGRIIEFDASHDMARFFGTNGTGGPQFTSPRGVAVDGSGYTYVADTENHRIQRFEPDGDFDRAWGSLGSDPGQLLRPHDVETGNGSVYVTDRDNNRIVRYSREGVVMAVWGSNGSGGGQFSQPMGLDIGSDGSLYVADAWNNRIQVFSPTGSYLRQWSTPSEPRGVAVGPDGIVYVGTGADGTQRFSEAGTPMSPLNGGPASVYSIEMDATGTLWLGTGVQLQRVRPDGSVVTTLPGGAGDLAFTADRRIVVVGTGNELREYQGGTGALLDVSVSTDRNAASVGGDVAYRVLVRNTGTVPLEASTVSSVLAPECNRQLADLAVGASVEIPCTHRMTAGNAGQFVNTVVAQSGAISASAASSPVSVEASGDLRLVRTVSGLGTPTGLEVEPGGNFLVSETENGRVRTYADTGTLLRTVNGPSQADDVASTPNGELYVSHSTYDNYGHNVDSTVVRRSGPSFPVAQTFNAPGSNGVFTGMTVDGDGGDVYVTEIPGLTCTEIEDDPWSPSHGLCVGSGPQSLPPRVQRITSGGSASVLTASPTVTEPLDIAVGGGQVYIVDRTGNRVVTVTTAGTFVRNLPITSPDAVTVAPDGTVYVVAAEEHAVRAYSADGTLLSTTPVTTSTSGSLKQAAYLDTDAAGRIYLLDAVTKTLRIYEPRSAIEGTVTAAGSGDPVADAFVAVLRTADFALVGGANTDAQGDYEAEVPAGSYFLYLIDPRAQQAPGFFGPTVVTVTAGTVAEHDPVMAPGRGSVTGTVTEDGGGPAIGGAWAVALSGTTGAAEAMVAADGSGEYTLEGLRPGDHFVGWVDPTGEHRPEFYPNAASVPDATDLAVAAGASVTADGSLATQPAPVGGAALTGAVTEEGSGDPLGGVHVVALRSVDLTMVAGAVTDGSGQFSLDVAAGDYKVAFIDSSGAHELEWFDDQPYYSLGTAGTVTAPGVADAALGSASGMVAGTVTDEVSHDGLPGVWVVAIGADGSLAGGSRTAAGGEYVIAGLPPGSYRVTAVDSVGGRAQEYYDGAADYAGATDLVVSAGAATPADLALGYP